MSISGTVSLRAGHAPVCARLHPQRRQHLFELSTQRHSVFVEEAQLEEGGIRLEAVRHGNVTANVVALERIAVYIVTLNRTDRAAGHVT